MSKIKCKKNQFCKLRGKNFIMITPHDSFNRPKRARTAPSVRRSDMEDPMNSNIV